MGGKIIMNNKKDISLNTINFIQAYGHILLQFLISISFLIHFAIHSFDYAYELYLLLFVYLIYSFIPFKNENMGYLYNYLFNMIRNYLFFFINFVIIYLMLRKYSESIIEIIYVSLIAALLFSVIFNTIFNFVPMCLFVIHLDYNVIVKILLFILCIIPIVRLFVVLFVLFNIYYSHCIDLEHNITILESKINSLENSIKDNRDYEENFSINKNLLSDKFEEII